MINACKSDYPSLTINYFDKLWQILYFSKNTFIFILASGLTEPNPIPTLCICIFYNYLGGSKAT